MNSNFEVGSSIESYTVPSRGELDPGKSNRKQQDSLPSGYLLRLYVLWLVAAAAIFSGASPAAAQSVQSATNQQTKQNLLTEVNSSSSDAYTTTVNYVVQFYPLWFTYYQQQVDRLLGTTNMMVAPKSVTPLYHFVVAINSDTLYSSVYFDLRTEPVVVTIPQNPNNVPYSILVLDPYGNEIPTGIPAQTPGVYAFTGPGFSGTLPDGVTPLAMPINFPSLYVRTVKLNQLEKAEQFRAALKTQTLSKYLADPNGGPTKILPEAAFAVPFKTTADTLIANSPATFLKMLQTAVAAPNTPALSEKAQALSNHFNSLFGNGNSQQSEFDAGAQKGLELIVSNYVTKTGATNWIHFTNIGEWNDDVFDDVLDRSSITEYLQLGNSISTAAYYHTFDDVDGNPLDGSNPSGYVLKFPAGQIPPAKRFWSVTAYTPNAIELVPNEAQKYVVASYTPGLQYNSDGSLEVYMSAKLPDGVPAANWLPVPSGKFNIMIRVYGPDGSVLDNTYVPPGIGVR